MWNTIKSWFVPERPLTLEERHAKALRRAEGALYTFRAVADDLENASAALREVSIEASENARVQQERANAALVEANSNLTRAEKVRDFIG